MNEKQKLELKRAWSKLSNYYQLSLSDDVILMYVDDVADLDFDRVNQVLTEYRRNPKNTRPPLPAHVRALIAPPEDDDAIAKEVAARILTACSKYGREEPGNAHAYIGELGWTVVQKQGGWWTTCLNIANNDGAIYQAQLRDLAKAQIYLAKRGELDVPPKIPSTESLRLSAQAEPNKTRVNELVRDLSDQKQLR